MNTYIMTISDFTSNTCEAIKFTCNDDVNLFILAYKISESLKKVEFTYSNILDDCLCETHNGKWYQLDGKSLYVFPVGFSKNENFDVRIIKSIYTCESFKESFVIDNNTFKSCLFGILINDKGDVFWDPDYSNKIRSKEQFLNYTINKNKFKNFKFKLVNVNELLDLIPELKVLING